MIRRSLLIAALAVLSSVPPAAGQDSLPPPVRVPRELADRFLAAFRAKDAAATEFIRARPVSGARDPFIVANELLRRHAEGALRDPPETTDFLAAARALAEKVKDIRENEGLPAVVEGWSRLGAADLRREADLQGLIAAIEEAAHRGASLPERIALAESARPSPGISGIALRRHRAGLLSDAGRNEEAVAAWGESRREAAAIRWTAAETSCLWQAGYLLYRRGDLAAARSLFREHLEVVEARCGSWARPEARRWLAAAEAALGENAAAIDLMDRSVAEARGGADPWQEAQSTEFLGRMHASLGHYAAALDHLERARGMYLVPPGSRLGAANCLDAMGAVFNELGRPSRAIPALLEALSELEAIGYRREAARARSNLGAAYEATGRGDDALREMERAMADWEALHDLLGAARTLGLLGDLHLRAGRLDRALACQQGTIDRYEAMGNRPGAARALAALGEIRAARGEHRIALDLAYAAKAEAEAIGDRRGAARALRGMAVALRALSRNSEALSCARDSVDRQVALGAGLGEEDAAGLRREVQAAADAGLLAAWDVMRSEPHEALSQAFFLAESSRGLLLAEGIVNREALFSASVPAALREVEAAARGRVAALAKSAGDPAALNAAYRDLEAAIARVQRESRRVADVVYPRPVPLEEFRASLPPSDALAIFLVTAERTFALVVSRDSADMFDLGESGPLVASVAAYADLVGVDGSEEGPRAAALYDALLRPLERALGGRTRLLICPDGALSFLPFEALLRIDGERRERAVERWEIAYVPSATVLWILRSAREAPGTGILAVGDPVYPGEKGAAPAGSRDAEVRGMGLLRRLPGTAAEVRAIAALAPAGSASLLLRERATGGALGEALSRTKGRLAALHLACHGHLDAERPRLAGLALSGGEILGLDDIYRMKVPADLVVLSACASARGRVLDGEGAMGLARGFFFAGASRVVVSDWAVSDEATRSLMESFYRRMLREGRAPAEALRAAKIEALRSGGPLAHPAHWAAFVIWGD